MDYQGLKIKSVQQKQCNPIYVEMWGLNMIEHIFLGLKITMDFQK